MWCEVIRGGMRYARVLTQDVMWYEVVRGDKGWYDVKGWYG